MAELVGYLAYGVAGWLVVVGCYGLVTSRHYVHAVVCLSVIQSATYLMLLVIGWTRGASAPVFGEIGTKAPVVDPVVQALSLTDVVVGGAATALLLALTIQLVKRHGTADPDRVRSLEQESEE